jgi:hypothetical protein
MAGLFGAGIAYVMGYKSAASGGGDASGLLRMVMGILTIILFVTMFSSVLTSMYSLYSNASAGNYTAFQTVVQITPTIVFLSGIFAGGMTTYGGYKARKQRGTLRLA